MYFWKELNKELSPVINSLFITLGFIFYWVKEKIIKKFKV